MICLCVFIYDFIYEFIYGIICRYIWAYREQLCRSVHDMSKQRYATKKYGVKAWQALAEWIYQCGDDDESNRRQSLLITFGKDDTDFWDVVAACLWTLATAANLPWGRSAIQPSVYSAVPDYEKVFFFSLSITQTIYGLTYVSFVCPCSYVIQAWAFSCGVRHILNKAPAMWLKDFPHDVWVLHRKLHHRFLKFRKSFRAATERLPLFQQGVEMSTPAEGSTQRPAFKTTSKHNVICLLSDSPGEESSATTGESDEGEGTQEEDEKDESQEEDENDEKDESEEEDENDESQEEDGNNNDEEGSGDTSVWEDTDGNQDDEEEEGNQDDDQEEDRD